MSFLRRWGRLLFIYYIFLSYRLDKVVLGLPIFARVQFLAYLNPWNWRKSEPEQAGRQLRMALERLGPIFVKFGQVLSTRVDILPRDVAQELALLQDRVPPFASSRAVRMVEKIYRKPIAEVFKHFDPMPLASASVAQVHAATLWNDKKVVVKILRPGVKPLIARDVALLYSLASIVELFWMDATRFKAKELVAEFEHSLLDELDLRTEAANAAQLRRNFTDSKKLYVPEVYWQYSEQQIMVIERIYGVPIAQIETLKNHQVDFKILAERGVEIFFRQVFKHNFFHADMHPGNIFVNIENPQDPKYIAVDFGIMGTLSTRDQRYLAENMLAFFKRDYKRVAELHQESGWIPSDISLIEFEAAMRTVCEPSFERPLKDISFGQMLMQLIHTARRFRIEIQPQLILLQKTLLNVEGLGRQLYPELDLWQTAKPFLERWLNEQLGPRAVWRKIKMNLPYWAEKLPDMPGLIYDVLQAQKQPPVVITTPPNQKIYWRGFAWGMLLGIISIIAINHWAI